MFRDKETNKLRVQIDLSPVAVERMNMIMNVCDMDTRKDLFNNAISLLEWAVMEVRKGRIVASFDENTKDRQILQMPILTAASHHPMPVLSPSPMPYAAKVVAAE